MPEEMRPGFYWTRDPDPLAGEFKRAVAIRLWNGWGWGEAGDETFMNVLDYYEVISDRLEPPPGHEFHPESWP
jgi:hypothetical protein